MANETAGSNSYCPRCGLLIASGVSHICSVTTFGGNYCTRCGQFIYYGQEFTHQCYSGSTITWSYCGANGLAQQVSDLSKKVDVLSERIDELITISHLMDKIEECVKEMRAREVKNGKPG